MGLFDAGKSKVLGSLLSLDIQLTDKDYFRGIKTILNSETAALKVVEDIFNNLPSGSNWDDPDFGPSEEDPNGVKSIYYTEPFPKGLLNPENITWRRPADISTEKAP